MKNTKIRILAAFILATFEFSVMFWKIYIPVPGMDIIIDPGELFITLGAVFSGVPGTFFIVLARTAATIWKGDLIFHFAIISMISHITAAGVFLFFYGKFIKKESIFLKKIIRWIILITAYYLLILLPVFHLLSYIFIKQQYIKFFGETENFLQTYLIMARIYLKELFFTIFLSTVILAAIPEKSEKEE